MTATAAAKADRRRAANLTDTQLHNVVQTFGAARNPANRRWAEACAAELRSRAVEESS